MFGFIYVKIRIVLIGSNLLFRHLPDHSCRSPECEAVIRNDRAAGDQRSCADDAVVSDLGAIHNGGMHANQCIVANCTAVKKSQMSNRRAFTDDGGISLPAVDNAVVLYIGIFADDDLVLVPAKYGVKPYAAVLFGDYVADYLSAFSDEGGIIYFSHYIFLLKID